MVELRCEICASDCLLEQVPCHSLETSRRLDLGKSFVWGKSCSLSRSASLPLAIETLKTAAPSTIPRLRQAFMFEHPVVVANYSRQAKSALPPKAAFSFESIPGTSGVLRKKHTSNKPSVHKLMLQTHASTHTHNPKLFCSCSLCSVPHTAMFPRGSFLLSCIATKGVCSMTPKARLLLFIRAASPRFS